MNLEVLYQQLVEMFNYINILRNQQCIIAFGYTGCGKSTMFNSLIFGPSSVRVVNVETEIEVPLLNGKTIRKKKLRKTIDIDPDRVPINYSFRIGHSQSQSETFLPNLLFEKKTGNIYVDMAGLHDTSGDIIQLINWLITKQVFNIVHSFHLIVPITINQIMDARGHEMHE